MHRKVVSMPIDFTFRSEGDVLWVTAVSNFFTLEEARHYIQSIGEAGLQHQVNKIFCDESQMTYRLGIAESFE